MIVGTGLPGLDKILHGLREGDNVVWQIDNLEDYIKFVTAMKEFALASKEKLIYFRFGKHKPVLKRQPGVTIYKVRPEAGFENFITSIHDKINKIGKGGYYVFDSMSDLSNTCYSDRMIGNFFKLTCPLLRDLETIAYFCIYRNFHSYHALNPISSTTQLLLDVYQCDRKVYVKPSKVDGRNSPTMFMLHSWEEDGFFYPRKESSHISRVLSSSSWTGLASASYRMVGVWDKTLIHAEEMVELYNKGEISKTQINKVFQQILKLIISREPRILKLAEKYFSLQEILYVWKRMIGTGMIGGKSVGMLLARAILKKDSPRKADEEPEEHDSFFIGSDVFYTFLVENDCWWERQRQKNPKTFMEGAEQVREKILNGRFPEYIITRFNDMLEYFGRSPIIVRSSSLLEDNFGNAFSGKYESVFCVNQGDHAERFKEFLNAVRVIYASAMSREALEYRKKRGVLEHDEQMALLVQRVSGRPYGNYFFPQLAGVAISFNPYAWNRDIDPEAGLMRLVFGLGTRAVDRSDDDYTRVVALNVPEKRPESNFDEVKRYAQKKVDLLDMNSSKISSREFVDLVNECSELPVHLYATRDREVERYARERGLKHVSPMVLTFDKLFKESNFIEDIKSILTTLKKAYGVHVDIEFTTNFMSEKEYIINLVQCRPLQVQVAPGQAIPLPEIKAKDLLLKACGAVIGQSRFVKVERLVYVVPEIYGKFPERKRYEVANLIGRICHLAEEKQDMNIVLIGPGRWGTSTPSLGIPVTFSEINTASVLCEIDSMHEGLVPDLSLGTHFFNDIVEMNMLYIAYFTEQKDNCINTEVIMNAPNRLTELLPNEKKWADCIRVVDSPSKHLGQLYLNANSFEKNAVIYSDNA